MVDPDWLVLKVSSGLMLQVIHPTVVTWSEIWLRLLLVLLLIAINAFFVTAEFAMVSVRRSRINQLVEEGDIPAKTVQELQNRLDRLLSTTQIGITLSSLALGWIGENTMAILVKIWLDNWPISVVLSEATAHSVAIPVFFLAIAYLQIVLGELCPKSVALLYSEELARFLGPPSLAIARFFTPFIWILNQSTYFLLQLMGIRDPSQGLYNRVTSEELQLIIATEDQSSGLETEARELLNNVFEFSSILALEVMIPRTRIDAIPDDATFQMLCQQVATSGHSRYPVKGESLDDIKGIIYFKELAEPLAQGQISLETPIQDWIHPALFVPEYTPLNELLSLMQRSHQEIVMVVDEFGGTAGLVTIQDLVSEIIGYSDYPNCIEDLIISTLDERTVLVQAQTDIEEINDLLNLDLPLIDEYQTLGGFLIYQLQKIPTVGEILLYNSLEFTIVSTEGPRLHQIQIHRLENEDKSF